MSQPTRARSPRLLASILALFVASQLGASSALALSECRVQEKHDGTLQVFARGVRGPLRFGTTPEVIETPFANESKCVQGGRASKCVLAEKQDRRRKTHPPFCELHLGDDEDTCVARVGSCIVGARPVCPPDMERMGSTCIDRTASTGEFNEAIAECTARGRTLCTPNEIMACDINNFLKGEPDTCGTLTDTASSAMWTLDSTSEGAENIFNQVQVYLGDNRVRAQGNADGTVYEYACCAPLGTP